MGELVLLGLIIGFWVILNHIILPRLGIPT